MTTTWTNALGEAARAVRDEANPHPYGHKDLDQDVRARAREFACVPPGHVLKPHQEEYLICFLQRLDTRPSHKQFQAACKEAVS